MTAVSRWASTENVARKAQGLEVLVLAEKLR